MNAVNMCNMDTHQSQKRPTLTELCYFMSVAQKWLYFLVNVMLLSQNGTTKILTIKLKVDSIAFSVQLKH